jgi:mono/diheme cytochrome c family protein
MSGRNLLRALITSAAVWTVAFWAVAGGAPSGQRGAPRADREDMSQYLPPGAGKALVARECTVCHDLDGVVRLRTSKGEWEAVVLDMVARGAPLMIEDADAIIAYLSEVFGPQAPPLVDVNTASADELAKLPGVTSDLAGRLVQHRQQKGPFSSRDEVRAALGFDEGTFEKVKWYLRAQPNPPASQ